jgi:hypothetical protein
MRVSTTDPISGNDLSISLDNPAPMGGERRTARR